MIISKTHRTPIYGTKFCIVIYDDDKQIQSKFKNTGFDPSITEFDGGVFKYKGLLYLVLFADDKKKPTHGVIAHESKHLVNNIFIEICQELDRYNDEPECYLLGWFVDRVHESLIKFRNGKGN